MNHLALVIPTLDRIGGAESQVVLLALGMHRRGWRVSVVTLTGDGGSSARELSEAGIVLFSLRMRKGIVDPVGLIRFQHWIRTARPDIIHAHLPHAAWLARFSHLIGSFRPSLRLNSSASNVVPSRLSGAIQLSPIFIDTIHSPACGPMLRRLAYRATDWLADCVTAVSRSVADTYIQHRMVSRDKIAVVPNGIDVNQFRPDALVRATVRRELGLADEFLWVAVGRLEPGKDYHSLLSAFALLTDPARLIIVGQGPLQEELAKLSVQLGIERSVRFLGFQSDVRSWLQAADGFVLASRREGLPLSLLEAGACALPAVATDVSGSREVIVDGRTGLLTPLGATAGLARSMNVLMRLTPRYRRSMGRLARQRICEHFSIDTVLDRWLHIYSDQLDTGAPLTARPHIPFVAQSTVCQPFSPTDDDLLGSHVSEHHENSNVPTLHDDAGAIPETPNHRIRTRLRTSSNSRLNSPQ